MTIAQEIFHRICISTVVETIQSLLDNKNNKNEIFSPNEVCEMMAVGPVPISYIEAMVDNLHLLGYYKGTSFESPIRTGPTAIR